MDWEGGREGLNAFLWSILTFLFHFENINFSQELKLYFILSKAAPDDVWSGTGRKSSPHKAQIESSLWLQLCMIFYAIFFMLVINEVETVIMPILE